jgi:hypothetical protein
MVVTCPMGMRIPAVPVSKHNPVLSALRLKCGHSLANSGSKEIE